MVNPHAAKRQRTLDGAVARAGDGASPRWWWPCASLAAAKLALPRREFFLVILLLLVDDLHPAGRKTREAARARVRSRVEIVGA